MTLIDFSNLIFKPSDTGKAFLLPHFTLNHERFL